MPHAAQQAPATAAFRAQRYHLLMLDAVDSFHRHRLAKLINLLVSNYFARWNKKLHH